MQYEVYTKDSINIRPGHGLGWTNIYVGHDIHVRHDKVEGDSL